MNQERHPEPMGKTPEYSTELIQRDTDSRFEPSRFWWLYFPILFFAARYAIGIFSDSETGLESMIVDELGLVETLTVLFLVLALYCSINLLLRHADTLHIGVKIFILFYCLGCVYFAGEEASWGQHWFGWETGEFFQDNDQGETNLHNTSVWLDRVPKGIISLLIFIGGIVAPIWNCLKDRRIDYRKIGWWLWPTRVCLPTAFFACFATWPSKIERQTGVEFYFHQAQEMKELYIALFILLFIVSLNKRLDFLRREGVRYSPL